MITFFFSVMQFEHLTINLERPYGSILAFDKESKKLFEYTEATISETEHAKPPTSKFSDFKIVATCNEENVVCIRSRDGYAGPDYIRAKLSDADFAVLLSQLSQKKISEKYWREQHKAGVARRIKTPRAPSKPDHHGPRSRHALNRNTNG